jgi:hypothetical protein
LFSKRTNSTGLTSSPRRCHRSSITVLECIYQRPAPRNLTKKRRFHVPRAFCAYHQRSIAASLFSTLRSACVPACRARIIPGNAGAMPLPLPPSGSHIAHIGVDPGPDFGRRLSQYPGSSSPNPRSANSQCVYRHPYARISKHFTVQPPIAGKSFVSIC